MISSPRTPVERLLWAYQFGHAWNRDAKYANLRNLDTGRIKMMDGSEADAKLLIASWQDFEPNVERLVMAYHQRPLQPDGEWGPASEFASKIRRCAMTDFAPPAGADLSTEIWDNPDLLGAIKSYQEYAAYRNNDAEYVGGSGSWPKGCDPTKPDVHSTRVSINNTSASAHQKAQLSEVLAAVERCEAEIGQAVRHILNGNPEEAEHDVRFQYIAGGVIGFAYFPRPNTCQQTMTCRLDNSFNVEPMTMAELNQHEYKGHSDGLEHVNRTSTQPSIMHPSIGRPTKWPSWIGDRHESTKKRYFGGVPIPGGGPGPGPGPGPKPTPEGTLILAGVKYDVYKSGTKPDDGGIRI